MFFVGWMNSHSKPKAGSPPEAFDPMKAELVLEDEKRLDQPAIRCKLVAPINLLSMIYSMEKTGKDFDMVLDVVAGNPRNHLVRRTVIDPDKLLVRTSDQAVAASEADQLLIYEDTDIGEIVARAPISTMMPVEANGRRITESRLWVYDIPYNDGDKRPDESWNLVLVERNSTVNREFAFANPTCTVIGT